MNTPVIIAWIICGTILVFLAGVLSSVFVAHIAKKEADKWAKNREAFWKRISNKEE